MIDKNVMPNYKNSIMNIATSLLKYYKAPTNHGTIYEIDNALKKNIKMLFFS